MNTEKPANISKMLCSRKGFTLVELVVALAISAICFTAIGGILISSMNLTAHAQTAASEKQIGLAISDFCKTRTDMTEAITPSSSIPGTLGENQSLLYVGDASGVLATTGYLWYQADNASARIKIFPESFYKDLQISLDIAQKQNTSNGEIAVKETIHLHRNGSEINSYEHSFKLINFDATSTWPGDASMSANAASAPFCLIIDN